MATASVTNTLVNGSTPLASVWNTNYQDLVDFLNNSVVHRDGSKAMTGALSMGSQKITDLATPTSVYDAATKAYADTKAEASHNHSGTDITSGTIAVGRLPVGTTSSHVAAGNHTHSGYASSSHTTHATLQATSGGSTGSPGVQVGDSLTGLANASGYIYVVKGANTVMSGNGTTELYLGGVVVGSATPLEYSAGSQVYKDTSSRRYKVNIVDEALPEGLVDGLQPVSYEYDPEVSPDTSRHLYFIAEDVFEAVGQDERFVIRDEEDRIDNLRIKALVAMLVSEVQGLRRRVAELEG